jgi:hypothetical protein
MKFMYIKAINYIMNFYRNFVFQQQNTEILF